MRKKIYFGHPINAYGTELEKRLMEKISSAFPEAEIVNPGDERHKEEYRRWQKENGSGMDYFFKKVLPECSAGVFLPFRDDAWGAGIFGEAELLAREGFPIYQITVDGLIEPADLGAVKALTVEETRVRIRDADGKTIPY